MINTDKYEGHTKGDNEVGWRINNNFVSNGKCPNDRYIAYVQTGVTEDDGRVMEFSDADANLIADAPKLLAEVKRLHASIEEIIDYLNQELDDFEKAPPAKVMLVGIKACLQEMIE